jgi:hypothetical protein
LRTQLGDSLAALDSGSPQADLFPSSP